MSANGGEGGGFPQILIFADMVRGGGTKGPKYTDVLLEQPLTINGRE